MKKLIGISLATMTLTFALALPTPQPTGKITLSWDYGGQVSTDLVFKIYHSTNASLPMTNWTLVATVPGTNRSYSLTVTPGVNFLAMTASNFWGEGLFSDAASMPALPSSAANLSLSRTN